MSRKRQTLRQVDTLVSQGPNIVNPIRQIRCARFITLGAKASFGGAAIFDFLFTFFLQQPSHKAIFILQTVSCGC
jgi:hypothetical protein